MQIAVSTASLSRNTVDALTQAAALGFTHVEINLQTDEFDYGYRRRTNARFYRQLRKQIDNLGLRVWSVTTPPLTQEQMFYERARKDILLSAAIAAGILGGQVFVVRPADIFVSEITFESYINQKLAPPVIEGYDDAWAQTVNRHMSMALRNQNHWIGALLTNQSERLAKVTGDLAIGWAMDVRSAANRSDLAGWLALNGERLAVAHLYDFVDEQYRPPLGEEWRDWLPQLAQTRLKCGVIHVPHPAGADELARSRDHLQQILASS